MNWRALRERYAREPWPRQLGNLASTLGRLAGRCGDPRYDDVTRGLLREAAMVVDWLAPRADPKALADLADAQREILGWWRLWPLDAARPLLRLRAGQLSERMLALSGLGDT
jgi:hypothetical protein